MTGTNRLRDDDALRRAFLALRREEAGRVPSFDSTMTSGRARRAKRRVRAGGVAAIAIAALLVTARSVDRSADAGGALAAELLASRGVWRGPTDFLLRDRREPLWRSTATLRESLTYTRMPQ